MAWEIRFEFEDDFIIKEKAGSCESPFLFDLCLQQYLRISLRAFWAGDSPTEVHTHLLSLKNSETSNTHEECCDTGQHIDKGDLVVSFQWESFHGFILLSLKGCCYVSSASDLFCYLCRNAFEHESRRR